MKLDPRSINFWPYDIFGYFIPGALLVCFASYSNSHVYSLIQKSWESDDLKFLVILSLLTYVLGHIVSMLSSVIFEKIIVSRIIHYPTDLLFNMKKSPLPYVKPFSNDFIDMVYEQIDKIFTRSLRDSKDMFWLAWETICIMHPIAYRRATHFLELYGLSRNTAMAMLLTMTMPFFPGWNLVVPKCIWVSSFAVACLIFFLSYLKLLARLTKETYRAFATCTYLRDSKNKAAPLTDITENP